MQMVSFNSLIDINVPALTFLFFDLLIQFANMDILSFEDIYREMSWPETTPLNEKFDAYGMDTKLFLVNSASIVVLQVLLLAKFIFYGVRIMLNRRAPRTHFQELKEDSQRLFLESYFDLCFCSVLNVIALFNAISNGSISEHFSDFGRIFNSVLTIVYSILIIYVPIWVAL